MSAEVGCWAVVTVIAYETPVIELGDLADPDGASEWSA